MISSQNLRTLQFKIFSYRKFSMINTKLFCFLCSSSQTKGKAEFAASASFRLAFKSANILLPLLVVVIAIYPFQA